MAAAQGFVAPGYEAVKQAFEQHLQDGIEEHVQCCAYVSGIKVVDLWGTNQDNATNNTLSLGNKYGPESLQNIFSSTKAVTSLVVAMLEDRGHISYEQLVTKIWPEFAAHGKGDTTIEQVMKHEGMLYKFDCALQASELAADRIKDGSVSNTIANQKPVRLRKLYCDRNKSRLRELYSTTGFKDQLYIGLPDKEHGRVAPLRTTGLWWSWYQ
eukprot:gene25884-32589_t